MAHLPSFLIPGRAANEVETPWFPDQDDLYGELTPSAIAEWRLHRYLASGGIRALATSSMCAMVRRRQNRFLWLMAFVGVLWVVFRFV